ncbi:hypothetical protein Acsp07_13140 [Actinomycetospora sp. NBRC 106378]|nr:hypothetical protein Acsp07_13140 [Actinomycetospora sp. NBRC 106378]
MRDAALNLVAGAAECVRSKVVERLQQKQNAQGAEHIDGIYISLPENERNHVGEE